MAEYDELAADAPPWFADIAKALSKGRNDEALRQARERLVLSKESGDAAGEFAATRLLVKAQLAKGDSWNARRTASEALAVANGSKDKKAIASLTLLLAKLDLKDRKFDDAVSGAREAEKLYTSLGFKAGTAAATSTLASVHVAKKELDKAQQAANLAIETFKEIGDPLGEASALKVMLETKMSEDRFYHASMIVEDMIKLYQAADNADAEAIAKLLAAEIHLAQGDLQTAMDTASEAVDLFDQVGNTKKKAAVVLVMAKAFQEAGQLQDARQAAEAAQDLFQQGRDKRGQASALVTYAGCLAAENQFGSAAYKMEEASFLYRQLKDKREETRALAESVSLHLKMIDTPQALLPQGQPTVEASRKGKESCAANAARVVELFGELGAGRGAECGSALVSLAKALLLTEERKEAYEKATEALSIFEELADPSGQSNALLLIGMAHQDSGDNDLAIESLEKSRELAEEAGDNVKIVSKRIKEIGKVKGGAKKNVIGGTTPKQDIIIFRSIDVHYIKYDSFEGRSTTVAPPKGSSSKAVEDVDYYNMPTRKKVLFSLRMQRVPDLDLVAASQKVFAA